VLSRRAVLLHLLLVGSAYATDSTYKGNDGVWFEGGNWTAGIPQNTDDVANFDGVMGTPGEVDGDGVTDIFLGTLNFSGSQSYDLEPLSPASFIFSATSVNAKITTSSTVHQDIGDNDGGVILASNTDYTNTGSSFVTMAFVSGSGTQSLNVSGRLAVTATGTAQGNTAYTLNLADSTAIVNSLGSDQIFGDLKGAAGSTITMNNSFTVGTANSTTFSGNLTDGIGHMGGFHKHGTGTITLSGNNNGMTSTSFFSIENGTISISSALNVGSAQFFMTPLTGLSSTLAATGTMTLTNLFKLGAGGPTIFDVASSQILTLNGVISDASTPATLTKMNAGTLVLGAVNTYSNGTILQGGTVSIANDNNLGTGDITFSGASTLATSAGVTSGKAVAINAPATFDIATGALSTFSGQFTGASSLTKTSSGTLALSNATNNFSGGTTIAGGTLSLTMNGILAPAGSVNITATGVNTGFNISGTNAGSTIGDLSGVQFSQVTLGTMPLTVGTSTPSVTFGGLLGIGGDTGTVTKQGSGTWILSETAMGASTGGLIISAGTAQVDGVVLKTTVNSGATLKGTGTAGNVVVDAGGFIAPGDSIGTINVGTITINGTLINEINPTASDLINASGLVTLGAGSVLQVSAVPGTYAGGTIYKVIQSTQPIMHQFTSLTTNNPSLDLRIDYSIPNQVRLIVVSTVVIVPFQNLGSFTGNPLILANFLTGSR